MATVKKLTTSNSTQFIIKANFSAKDIELVERLSPAKLQVLSEDKKEMLFRVSVSKGTQGSVSAKGLTIPNVDGKVNMQIEIAHSETPEYVNVLGTAIKTHLSTIENQVSEYLTSARTNSIEELNN